MRPDEHKKKRSAQYQRKHGGNKDKGGDDPKATGGKRGKPKDKQAVGGKQPSYTSRHGAPSPQVADSSSSDSENEGGTRAVNSGKTYRRREIASNWGKYDIPPADAEDSAATPKGQDINKLLDRAGSAVAHFRFKEEEAWEAELEREGGQEQVLTLDCDELATSLECLPLYAQLHLDKDIFTTDQLAEMAQVAAKQRALMPGTTQDNQQNLPPSLASQDRSTQGHASHTVENSTTSISTASSSKDKSVNRTSTKQDNIAKKQEQNKAVSDEGRTAEHLPMDKPGNVQQESPSSGAVSSGISDAALDSLLDEDISAQRHSGSAAKAATAAVDSAGECFSDKDLDDLLSMDTGVVQPTADKPSTVPEVKGGGGAAESEDLEDWLDSVLDS